MVCWISLWDCPNATLGRLRVCPFRGLEAPCFRSWMSHACRWVRESEAT